jgi:hypothetical protein
MFGPISKHYETRAKSLGIDTLRVKYRQQRRQLIADIVMTQHNRNISTII